MRNEVCGMVAAIKTLSNALKCLATDGTIAQMHKSKEAIAVALKEKCEG